MYTLQYLMCLGRLLDRKKIHPPTVIPNKLIMETFVILVFRGSRLLYHLYNKSLLPSL